MNYAKEAEWSDFRVAVDGVQTVGLRGLTHTETDEDEALHAAGKAPLCIQSGNTTVTGSFKILKNELDALNNGAKALGYKSIKDVNGLVITASYRAFGARAVRTNTILGVKISSIPEGWEQGAKYMEIDLPFNALEVIRQ